MPTMVKKMGAEAISLVQVSHLGVRNPITGAIIAASQGLYQQAASQVPGLGIEPRHSRVEGGSLKEI